AIMVGSFVTGGWSSMAPVTGKSRPCVVPVAGEGSVLKLDIVYLSLKGQSFLIRRRQWWF
ncbi:MAG TPA: hypothetical protein VJ508_02990, partial [Saprospiraceae bacterium]|nr:hypothetical protein [Saprospiraceae bacterium]